MMEKQIVSYLPKLADFWRLEVEQLEEYYRELQGSSQFYEDLNQKVADVPQFSGTTFSRPMQLRVYRCMLYLFTRSHKPELFMETGVQHGFSSAVILLAMGKNQSGKLISVDIPPDDPRMTGQGTLGLPPGKGPGWIIPDRVRQRHELHLAPAEECAPRLLFKLAKLGGLDAFLHDSDHCYPHMMFEMALAWKYLPPRGMLLVDNIEQNTAFDEFSRNVDGDCITISSFDGPDRTWRHGLVRKPPANQG